MIPKPLFWLDGGVKRRRQGRALMGRAGVHCLFALALGSASCGSASFQEQVKTGQVVTRVEVFVIEWYRESRSSWREGDVLNHPDSKRYTFNDDVVQQVFDGSVGRVTGSESPRVTNIRMVIQKTQDGQVAERFAIPGYCDGMLHNGAAVRFDPVLFSTIVRRIPGLANEIGAASPCAKALSLDREPKTP